VLATSELLDFDRTPTWESWPPPIILSNMKFPLESNIFFCETLILGIYELLSLGFMDFEFPSNETML
jgi:hypothetical protein